MVVLFQDQSKNVQTITPFMVEFRLITSTDPPAPFSNHAVDLLDFTAGEIRVIHIAGACPHPVLDGFQDWIRIDFNH
jgi:hypothetical protein